MSEQFAMQPDEFDSTNSRLDSILDRLSALGESAAEMKVAPLRPLQSVPELGPVDRATSDVAEDLVPPAVPPLGLVTQSTPTAVVAPSPAPAVEATPVAQPVTVETPAPVAPAEEITQVETIETTTVAKEVVAVEIAEPVAQVAVAEEAVNVDPEPLSVEYHELDLAVPNTNVFDLAAEPEVPEGGLVFELDEPIESSALPTSVETPEAPGSIFGSTLGTPASDTTDDADTDGWISHHPEDEAASTGTDDVFETPEFTRHEETTPAPFVMSEAAAVESTIEETFNDEPTIDEPMIGEPSWNSESAVVETSPLESEADIASEVEEALGGIDAFTSLDDGDEPVAIAGIDIGVVETIKPFELNEEGLYDSDEELPLPDFTGVYTDAGTDDGFWGDESSIPDPIEPGTSAAAAGRFELDKLRPVEEESIVEEASSGNATLRVQLLGVILVGLIAFLAIWARDPNMINDMLDSIRDLFG